jgi:hypothetical protein
MLDGVEIAINTKRIRDSSRRLIERYFEACDAVCIKLMSPMIVQLAAVEVCGLEGKR